MATAAPHINTELDTVENHDAALAHKVGDLSVNDQQEDTDDDGELANHDEHLPNGHRDAPDYYASEKAHSVRSGTGGGGLLSARPGSTKHGSRPSSALGQHVISGDRASMRQSLSKAPGSPHSEYTHHTDERPDLQKRASRSYQKPIPIVTTYEPELPDNMSLQRRHSKSGSIKRPGSRTGSIRHGDGPAAPGEVMSPERQRDLQRVSLVDNGPDGSQRESRPRSAFGYRPEPVLGAVQEEGGYGGRESRAGGILGRSGTVVSRAGTMGRNGTLSRGANGGTIGSRKGAFGRGAGASIGTQPEEVLGRDDIHTRAELSERILDDSTLRRLTTMEKKDAKRLSKVIKQEGKAEAKAVTGSIKELERLVKLQREAAANERKSQLRLSKWTSREHKARLRFLKEKERYERIEGELRNAENDYEERRDHAGGLTAQVAEKTQDLDDLRGQKAADDRERAVKLLALKNPAHS